jgi:branched-subunit amino acid transport protein
LRQGFLLLLVLVVYYSRFMPVEWKRRVTVPDALSGFTEFTVVISVALLGLSGVC